MTLTVKGPRGRHHETVDHWDPGLFIGNFSRWSLYDGIGTIVIVSMIPALHFHVGDYGIFLTYPELCLW